MKVLYYLMFIPRLFIKIFHIKHKHLYLYNGTFDGGLAGQVSGYKCIWCGDIDIRY